MTYHVPEQVIDAALRGERVLLLINAREPVCAPNEWRVSINSLESTDGKRTIAMPTVFVVAHDTLAAFDRVSWSPSWWQSATGPARETVWAFHKERRSASDSAPEAADQNAEKLTKTPFRYVPLWFVAELAWVMWHGAQKAGRSLDCWKELEKDRVLADYPEAAMRHLQAIQEQGLGARDAESGRLHAVHVAGCAVIMAWHGTFC